MKIEILPLKERPEMADVCAAWSFAEWGCMMEGRTLEASVQGYRNSLKNDNLPVSWVAFCEGKPAGSIRLKLNDHPDITDLNPWLASVFVHPLFRGHGLAKALCLHLEDRTRNEYGFEKLYLFTTTAEKLYSSIGWKRTGTVRDPVWSRPEGAALMEKSLG